MVKNALKHFSILIAAMAMMPMAVCAKPDVTIQAALDSTVMVQGSKANLQLVILKNSSEGNLIDFPEVGKEYSGLDFSSLTIDTLNHGSGRIEINYNYTVQAFDPGTVTLPPFRYALGTDTVESGVVTLKVLEVDLDSLTDINPMHSVMAIPSRWYDFIPDWLWQVLLGLLIVVAIGAFIATRKHRKVVAEKAVELPPPYDLAVMRLNDLQAKKLPQSGLDKEYYTELTDILRQYLEGRFGINALEMTSSQIMHALRHNKDTRPGSDLMHQILQIADFVKFAKVRPLPEDNEKSFKSAIKFVEDSKPAPEPLEPTTEKQPLS